MKLVGILTMMVSIVSLVLIAWIILAKPWESEPVTVSLPPPQPTETLCETLTQQMADAMTEHAAAMLNIRWEDQGCE